MKFSGNMVLTLEHFTMAQHLSLSLVNQPRHVHVQSCCFDCTLLTEKWSKSGQKVMKIVKRLSKSDQKEFKKWSINGQ